MCENRRGDGLASDLYVNLIDIKKIKPPALAA
jgi:hypothetical protein